MNPYESLDSRAFWAPSVGQLNMFDIADLWRPKFSITKKTRVVTYGSCFAQHFSRALKKREFSWVCTERAPDRFPESGKLRFNYDVFSSRTGNIYTTSLLKQWTSWALNISRAPDLWWEKEGRYFDPFRPNIEPDGFSSPEEVLMSRDVCINSFRDSIRKPDLFVFTLGLTESWWNEDPDTFGADFEYPTCPGTIAGDFDPEHHKFRNQDFAFIELNLKSAIQSMRKANPDLKFLLTVSPVPLTATNSGDHVLVATMKSKSILRAVAGAVADSFDFVDYFPSYEIINSPAYRGTFFEPNMRSVNSHGVDHVMKTFFTGLGIDEASAVNTSFVAPETISPTPGDLVCEEELLEAFGNHVKDELVK